MPELPEVESLVLGIRKDLIGNVIRVVEFYRQDLREEIPVDVVKSYLVGQTIDQVTRRGKYALLHTKEGIVGIHLGMSGRFYKCRSSELTLPHTHAVFKINTKSEYRFVDPRRFGRIFTIPKNELATHKFLSHLGVEPLDQTIDLGAYLFEKSRRVKKAVKQFIMDHEVVVGVGNIYASESLWRAFLSPLTSANEITKIEFKTLAEAIRSVLSEAIKQGGTTFRDYRKSDGNPGQFQINLGVYGRDSKPCQRCGHGIVKVTQQGRSTYFCSFCQNKKTLKKPRNPRGSF